MKSVFMPLILLLTFTLSGCGILLDSAREGLGYPSLELLRAREDAVKQSFDISYDEAFERVLVLLKEEMELVIYTKNKKDRSIVAMGVEGCVDTTEVGIFFVEESPDKTTIEIASHSPKAKDIVSSGIFTGLAAEGE